MTAEVYLLQSSAALDGSYSYKVPESMEEDLAPGVFVELPFGVRNAVKKAVVWRTREDLPASALPYRLKALDRTMKELTPLTPEQMRLAEKMQQLYLCPMGDCVRCLMPPEGGRGRSCNFTVLTGDPAGTDALVARENFRNIAQIRVLEYLRDCGGRAASSEILRSVGCTISVLHTLEKYGFVRTEKGRRTPADPAPASPVPAYPPQVLTARQREAYDQAAALLDRRLSGEILLHGVTGSGKTEIYLQLIEKVLADGGCAIVLVPEISLTPQMSARFSGRFGNRVAVLHSRLTDGARNREWERIRRGEVSVVLGARSAVFAPFPKVALIILDEEHESTYKSEEQQPRYHARDIALLRGQADGGVVLFGSATPSVETFYRAQQGKMLYLPLEERVNRRPLPTVETIDMREELDAGERGVFSRRMREELRKNLEAGEQSLLFVHRRGFSGNVICTGCGKSMKCGKCNISMTYHARSDRLICHYCGNTVRMPERCPACGSADFSRRAFGTQKAQEELEQLFPSAKIVRMDADTTAGREGHASVLEEFTKGGGDILVGTQMVAKGHDFPNVTLAGVLSADSLTNAQDYRAGERAFQLLTQVAGRAGRGEKPGRVLIQAFDVDNYALTTACRQDYQAFYKLEIGIRKQLRYPPFCTMAVLGIIGTDDRAVFDYGILCRKQLTALTDKLFGENAGIEILGVTRAAAPKINNKYRWRILIKAPGRTALLRLLQAFQPPKAGREITGFVRDIAPGNLF